MRAGKLFTSIALTGVLAAVVTVPGAGRATAGTGPTANTGWVTYQVKFDSGPMTYAKKDPGSDGRYAVTNYPAGTTSAAQAKWSPDGTRVAYASLAKIWTARDKELTGAVALTSTVLPAQDSSPTWSADGTRIAFTSTRDGNPEIYVMKADGSSVRRLTNNTAIDDDPTFAPDGTITFASNRAGTFDLYRMNADGSGQALLVGGPADQRDPRWSRDGSKLAYWVDFGLGGPSSEVHVVNADLSPVSVLPGAPGGLTAASYPAFSPDGTRIVYVARDLGSGNNLGTGTSYVGSADLDGANWRTIDSFGCCAIISDLDWQQPPASSPPTVVPTLTCILVNGWCNTNASVSWRVNDNEMPNTVVGCPTSSVLSDTTGVTVSCTGTSSEGSATVSTVVKRDATPPTVTCVGLPTFAVGQVNATVSANVSDTLSGVASSVVSVAVDTRTAGTHTVTMTGRDLAFNARNVPCSYVVANPTCRGLAATIVATDGADRITGTSGRDVIVGLGGNDNIDGRGGDDVICGGAGDDTLTGGAGNDVLDGEAGTDTVTGAGGHDTCVNAEQVRTCEA